MKHRRRASVFVRIAARPLTMSPRDAVIEPQPTRYEATFEDLLLDSLIDDYLGVRKAMSRMISQFRSSHPLRPFHVAEFRIAEAQLSRCLRDYCGIHFGPFLHKGVDAWSLDPFGEIMVVKGMFRKTDRSPRLENPTTPSTS